MAVITAVGTAVPSCVLTQPAAQAFLQTHYEGRIGSRAVSVAREVFAHPSIRRRHVAFENSDEMADIVDENPDERMARFTRWAVRLSAEAVREALQRAGVSSDVISAVVVNTCTGYVCPGLSTYLLEALDLPAGIRLYDLVGAGCAGALPNLQLARDIVGDDAGKAAVSVSVEICSATFQMSDDLGLVVSNALFGDGAGAAIVRGEGDGWAVRDSLCHTDPGYRDDVRYVYRNGQLHNQLTRRVPVIVSAAVKNLLAGFLERHGLSVSRIRHWAIHPAGHSVIERIRDKVGLSEEQLAVTWKILADYGNMSSAGVWFELKRILEAEAAAGDWCVMLSFGAGFSVHIQLLRRNGGDS
ncbi:MAG: type III polyketide synthase [Lentisphaerae bacterium]|nr:type III polyketide synthase [Lentisphaerota bacterium]